MKKLKVVFVKVIKLFSALLIYVVYINGFYFLLSKIDGINNQQFLDILRQINTIDNYIFILVIILIMHFFLWFYGRKWVVSNKGKIGNQ